MGRKPKYSAEQKVQACEDYLSCMKSVSQIVRELGMEELIEAVYKATDYYTNFYPQRRFKGKTAGQIRKEALANENKVSFPIADS